MNGDRERRRWRNLREDGFLVLEKMSKWEGGGEDIRCVVDESHLLLPSDTNGLRGVNSAYPSVYNVSCRHCIHRQYIFFRSGDVATSTKIEYRPEKVGDTYVRALRFKANEDMPQMVLVDDLPELSRPM